MMGTMVKKQFVGSTKANSQQDKTIKKENWFLSFVFGLLCKHQQEVAKLKVHLLELPLSASAV